MNVVTRGLKSAFRSPLRSAAIVLMLAISIGLILSMLVARSSINSKIDSVKANAGTNITISPAGVMGFDGGGNNLTAAQYKTIASTAHITSTTASLSDQLGTSDTNLTSSLELGTFGQRQMRFEQPSSNSAGSSTTGASSSSMPAPTPHVTVTGTTNPSSVSTNGGSLTITSGKTIDGNSSSLTALVGTDLATKNNLKVGSSFTAYSKTVTVSGIYKTGNKFQDSGVIMPLSTVQTLTSQTGEISSVIAKVDSSENVSATVTGLKSALGSDKVDVVSEAEQAASSVSSLQSIASLALAGVIGSAIAGAVIILLAMIMVVRERRREIGVIKAIGGNNFKVVTQFVVEAMTLTVIGSVIGLALGVLVSGPMTTSLVSSSTQSSTNSRQDTAGGPPAAIRQSFGQVGRNFTEVTASLSPEIFASAVLITLFIAALGSAVPAWLISKVSPAEVLRSE